ncbi:glucosamine-6-phosphate deaminase [Membranihabitans marinus]|uniref:glucosamine-6-phosphate deaminase n=1 Tax=Membranihabitans marinus TaxID=1227546 RepID=UPI001F273415|nr:glucosamine-6-phosphate deaminase [Membranihabitans marinus]
MNISISDTPKEMGQLAGKAGAEIIKNAIADKGYANIIMATGTSQFETIQELIADKDIDWSKVTMFHLDEYIGISIEHKASFRKYLQERFISQIAPLKKYYLIDGEADPVEECKRLNTLIADHPIDVAFVGVGENGHLAFNDPPADFETKDPYLIVNLDLPCRAQQFNEGWFESIDDVPKQAISMSVNQIMATEYLICSVPDERKAVAVAKALDGEITPELPASILQSHANCAYYLDKASATVWEASKVN